MMLVHQVCTFHQTFSGDLFVLFWRFEEHHTANFFMKIIFQENTRNIIRLLEFFSRKRFLENICCILMMLLELRVETSKYKTNKSPENVISNLYKAFCLILNPTTRFHLLSPGYVVDRITVVTWMSGKIYFTFASYCVILLLT